MKKKIISIVLVFIMVFTLTSTAFASTTPFDTDDWWIFPGESSYVMATVVTGGPSQTKVQSTLRNEPNSMDVHVDKIDFNGQSNFKFRGYEGGVDCTYARKITGTGFNGANYLWAKTGNQYCTMSMSIASSNSSSKLYFVGRYAI